MPKLRWVRQVQWQAAPAAARRGLSRLRRDQRAGCEPLRALRPPASPAARGSRTRRRSTLTPGGRALLGRGAPGSAPAGDLPLLAHGWLRKSGALETAAPRPPLVTWRLSAGFGGQALPARPPSLVVLLPPPSLRCWERAATRRSSKNRSVVQIRAVLHSPIGRLGNYSRMRHNLARENKNRFA